MSMEENTKKRRRVLLDDEEPRISLARIRNRSPTVEVEPTPQMPNAIDKEEHSSFQLDEEEVSWNDLSENDIVLLTSDPIPAPSNPLLQQHTDDGQAARSSLSSSPTSEGSRHLHVQPLKALSHPDYTPTHSSIEASTPRDYEQPSGFTEYAPQSRKSRAGRDRVSDVVTYPATQNVDAIALQEEFVGEHLLFNENDYEGSEANVLLNLRCDDTLQITQSIEIDFEDDDNTDHHGDYARGSGWQHSDHQRGHDAHDHFSGNQEERKGNEEDEDLYPRKKFPPLIPRNTLKHDQLLSRRPLQVLDRRTVSCPKYEHRYKY
ncbi:hypothetical protein LTR64_006512 [Lithohypha guttulata]|uniref:uncharacterized protein n=1 Tax=Lithohypha guttulata TaxID=1690604 RepID=UPI002DDF7894|nr:hypothetical protein LTR51_004930 [Lithohypha guttulata]